MGDEMARRALGRGLEALIPGAGARATGAEREGVRLVRTADVRANRYQPRSEFDRASMEDLVRSVREVGILQPLVVRRAGDGYELIAGERRLRAAQEAGLEKVPVIVREAGEREALALALVENLQRSDLAPLEQAAGYHELMERFGLTQEEVARSVGLSRSAVANTLRLLSLPEEVKAQIGKGSLSAGHARVLVGLRDPGMQLRAARQIIQRGLSVRAAEQEFGGRGAGKDARVERERGGGANAELSRKLTQALQTRVRVSGSGEKGKIEIEFYSAGQLVDLVERLSRGL